MKGGLTRKEAAIFHLWMVDNDFFFFPFGLMCHSVNQGDVTGVISLQTEFADGAKADRQTGFAFSLQLFFSCQKLDRF